MLTTPRIKEYGNIAFMISVGQEKIKKIRTGCKQAYT